MDRWGDDAPGSHVEFDAHLEDLVTIRAFVEERCRALGATAEAAAGAALAVDELCANALEHGSSGTTVRVGSSVALDATRIVVTLIDDAGPFDPRAGFDAPPCGTDDVQPRGRGLRIVGRSVEGLAYRRDGGRNLIRFSVPCSAAPRGDG